MNKKSINRIVIGDVGSGKTIVAFLIALNYLKSIKKGTVVLLAPTEVLAYQHYQKLLEYLKVWHEEFFDGVDFIFAANRSVFLNGEKVSKKNVEYSNSEKSKFCIGTHALLYVERLDPDLVLVDEQHRFGVGQRQKLAQKKDKSGKIISPNFISFTATPIPRTLALTVFKSLKPHFLQTLTNRKAILTRIVTFDNLDSEVISQISSQLEKSRKVYVICAKVEDKESVDDDIWSISKATTLIESYFPGKVLSVHGKLTQKKDILQEFKDSDTKSILVATTVVEVGVDVSEATLVVILNAERFGLSALHQIRGRVGRNTYDDNRCFLVIQKEYQRSRRLKYLCEYQDGFKIAQMDLELRGAGDFLGKVQSGFDDEVNNLVGLNPELYFEISALVDSVNFDELGTELPRLMSYVEKESQKVWEE